MNPVIHLKFFTISHHTEKSCPCTPAEKGNAKRQRMYAKALSRFRPKCPHHTTEKHTIISKNIQQQYEEKPQEVNQTTNKNENVSARFSL